MQMKHNIFKEWSRCSTQIQRIVYFFLFGKKFVKIFQKIFKLISLLIFLGLDGFKKHKLGIRGNYEEDYLFTDQHLKIRVNIWSM